MKLAKFFMLVSAAAGIAFLSTACGGDGEEEQADSRFWKADGPGQSVDANANLNANGADLNANGLNAGESNKPGGYGEFNAENQDYLAGFGRKITNAPAFTPVYFPFDNFSVSPEETSKVTAIASFIKSNPGTGVVIEGNCDARGTQEYNRGLGERRAQAVKTALMEQGIAEKCIATQSYGADKPAVLGDNETAWSRNRRAEFVPVILNNK